MSCAEWICMLFAKDAAKRGAKRARQEMGKDESEESTPGVERQKSLVKGGERCVCHAFEITHMRCKLCR
jgi:hypothetical protein